MFRDANNKNEPDTSPESFLACRSRSKFDKVAAEIQKEDPSADLQFVEYDASSLEKVHATGRSFLEQNLPLDILLLNAGTIVGEPKPSSDGLEWIFAVNHLAHFALTMTLYPALERAAKEHNDVRVVSTTSAGFNLHPDPQSLHIDDSELEVANKEGLWWKDAMPMYGRSKTCNILFISQLSRRLRSLQWGKAVRCNAIHPGTVPSALNDSLRHSWYFWTLETLVYALAAIPSDQGAVNMLYAGTSDEVREKDITGKYLTPYGYVNSAPDKAAAGNKKLAIELWQRSKELCEKYAPSLDFSKNLA